MKKCLKYIFTALFTAGLMTACSPEDYEGVNESGIPQASAFSGNVKINVDQSINQVSFTLEAPAVYPVWTITLPNGKEEKSTVNGYTKIYTAAGDYKVTMKVGNRDGISDGIYETTFHINNSIVDFGKYTTMLSKANWHIANKEKGHLACGESGSDGTNWWSGDADCKLNEGVYDNELTFTSDFKYTFNPGDHGTIYVNKDVTIWPDYRNPDEDFNVPVETQTSEYGLEVDGDDLYLTFPKGTYFPYIANDDIWNTPKYKVINLTTKKMTLLIDNGNIAWQYILTTENTVEKAFTGFKYNSEFNLWKGIDEAKDYSTHYYYAPGWAQIADPEMTQEGSSYTWVLPEATTDQWQAQCPIKPTKLSLSAGAKYDFSCIITASEDLPGVTVKLTDVNTGDNYVFVERIPVKQYEDYVFYVSDVNSLSADADCELFFDFGGNPANTTITVKDIVVKDHANDDGTVLPSDEPEQPEGGVIWAGVNDAANLMTKGQLALASTWFADDNWGMLGTQPTVEITGRDVKLTNVEANGGAQWQGQLHLNTGVAIEEGKAYDFAIVLAPSQDVAGATVKPHPDGDDAHFFSEARHDIAGFEDNRVTYENVVATFSTENLVLTLDFPGLAAGATVDVKDIIVQEHNEAAAGGNSWVDANSAENLMNSGALALASTWFADNNWGMLGGQPEVAINGRGGMVSIVEANGSAQWQGQVHLNTGVAIEEGKTYDFAIILTSSQDINEATVKPHPDGDDAHFFSEGRHNLAAYEDTKVTYEQFTADFSTSNLVITLDFPSCEAGATIEIKDIIIQEHKAGGNTGGDSWVDVSSAANLMNSGALALASTWFADANWGMLGGQPDVAISGNTAMVTIVEGNGNAQWQGQVHLNTGVAIEEGKTYDFAITLTPSQDINEATVKPHPDGDDAHFFSEGRHNLASYEENKVVYEQFTADFSTSNLVITLDFPSCVAGTEIEIKDIIIQEHK